MSKSRRRRAVGVVLCASSISACGGDDPAPVAGSASTTSAGVAVQEGADAPVAASDSVFPPDAHAPFDLERTFELPGGGLGGVAVICDSAAGDLVYAGVSGVDGGLYTVDVGPDFPGDIIFTTGMPEIDQGFGVYQSSFDLPEYTMDFMDFDVSLQVPGCG